MPKIRVEYLYNGDPYRFSNNIFDIDQVMKITENLQKKYSVFAEKINQQDGYLEINISLSEILINGIHYEAFVMATSKELIDEINAWECSIAAQNI